MDKREGLSPGAISPASGHIPTRQRFQSGDAGSEAGDGRSSSASQNPDVDKSGMSGSASGNVGAQNKSKTTSAPTSPMKEKKASFFGKVSNFSAVVSQKVEQAKDAAGHIRVPGLNKDKCFTLLVIDDANTDWSKYFRGKRIHTDYDIKVEQAEFKELTVTAAADGGATASIILAKSGNKVVRSFKPDFLLVRQNVRDSEEDYRNLLLGFQYGNVPSVNSLDSIYNFQDKPWIFSQLLKAQHKLGKDNFPIIDQTYYPSHRDMVNANKYPCVFKIGHAHSGLGKIKVENEKNFQDMASVVAMSQSYCTVEPYVDAKFDLHVQKIGDNYKALMRKSLSGNWKTNIGQSILEEISVTDRYKQWIDEVSLMFGGLGICSLEAVVGKDGKEYIIEINDSATTLLGESQEDDRKHIADLVLKTMEENLQPSAPPAEPPATAKDDTKSNVTTASSSGPPKPPTIRQLSRGSLGKPEGASSMASTVLGAMAGRKPAAADVPPPPPVPPVPPKPGTSGTAKETPPPPPNNETAVGNSKRTRHDSQASESSTVSGNSSASSTVKKVEVKKVAAAGSVDSEGGKGGEETNGAAAGGGGGGEGGVEGEDTMKNLRKTFAGIFGDLG